MGAATWPAASQGSKEEKGTTRAASPEGGSVHSTQEEKSEEKERWTKNSGDMTEFCPGREPRFKKKQRANPRANKFRHQ